MPITDKLTRSDIHTALEKFCGKIVKDYSQPTDDLPVKEYLIIRKALSQMLDDLGHQPPKLAYDDETEIGDIVDTVIGVEEDHGFSIADNTIITLDEFVKFKEALLSALDKMAEHGSSPN